MIRNTCIILGSMAAMASAAEPKVSLVRYQVDADLPSSVSFQVKPMNYEYGAQLTMLVKGEDMVAIDEDSLVITSAIDADGEDLLSKKRGKIPADMASFPKIDEDGVYGRFGVKLRGDLAGKLEGSTIEGKVTISGGGDTETQKTRLKKNADSVAVGPFKMSFKHGKGGFFGDGEEGTSIKVVGDLDSIVELIVKDGDKELDGGGSSSSGNRKTYYFDKAEGDEVDVSIEYWDGLEDQVVSFSVTVGG